MSRRKRPTRPRRGPASQAGSPPLVSDHSFQSPPRPSSAIFRGARYGPAACRDKGILAPDMTGVQLIAVGHAAIGRADELISRRVVMAGGAVLGLGGGWALAQALRHLRLEASLSPVLVLAGGLAIFG